MVSLAAPVGVKTPAGMVSSALPLMEHLRDLPPLSPQRRTSRHRMLRCSVLLEPPARWRMYAWMRLRASLAHCPMLYSSFAT